MSDLNVATIGGASATNLIRVKDSTTSWVYEVPLTDALARGGLSMSDLVNGQNYTVVLVGPRAGMASGSWWSGFGVGIVKNAP
jgi:hypothetical protein